MVLDKIIPKEAIKLNISDIDKWTLIEELVDLIVQSGKSSDREAIISATLDREAKGSTGLENGIAIPHARSEGASDLVGALGISEEGIDFESKDGKPCHLIFLIVAPAQETTRYLKALSAVAFIAQHPEMLSRLKSAASPDEVLSILGEVEGSNG
jgi:mannitol/fructose-specific phosphotransferase system IIA component (Ntr-type)